MWNKVEEFKDFIEKDAKREFDLFQAFEIMRVNPMWFVDERSLELCELYLFFKPDTAKAFPGTFGEQPAIWISAKITLDGILSTSLL